MHQHIVRNSNQFCSGMWSKCFGIRVFSLKTMRKKMIKTWSAFAAASVAHTSCQVCGSRLRLFWFQAGLILQHCILPKNMSIPTTESTPCANIRWIMPDAGTHVEGVAQNPLSHLSLLPVYNWFLLFCKCKGMKQITAHLTHFTDKTFGFALESHCSTPVFRDYLCHKGAVFPFRLYVRVSVFHKRLFLSSPPKHTYLILVLSERTEILRCANINLLASCAYKKTPNHICSWHYTPINTSPHSSMQKILLIVFPLFWLPLISLSFIIILWTIDV